MRKPKKRVVDLRKKDNADSGSQASEVGTPGHTPLASDASSVIPEEREAEEELATPPRSPPKAGLRLEGKHGSLDGW